MTESGGKVRNAPQIAKWKTLETRIVFEVKPYLSIVREKVAVDTELVIDDFYQVHLRSFVACVPLLGNGKILMIRQYKHGPREVTLTFPGGFMEEAESATKACQRELLEETGYSSGQIIPLGKFMDNGNQRGCEGNFFLAKNCELRREPKSGDLEKMELVELEPVEIDQAVHNGDICLTHHAFAWFLSKEHLSHYPET